MPTIHKVYGGSNSERWKHCAGYASLSAQVPRRPTSEAAQKGTAQHAVMEQLLNDSSLDPDRFLDATVLGVTLEKEHIAEISIALESYDYILEQYPEDAVLFSERMVDLTDEAGGTCDAGIAAGEIGAIIDFKFGQMEVDVTDAQGLFYGICARKTEPAFAKVKQLDVWIIQPAFEPAHVKTSYPEHLLDLEETNFLAAIKASQMPNPVYIEGEWCDKGMGCEAKLACPAKLQRLETLTQPNHVLDLDDLGAMLKKFKSWKKWMEEAEERLLYELEHGRKNPHWKLVDKRATRQWKSEAKAITAFRKAKVDDDTFMPRSLVSPAQAEKEKLLSKKIVEDLAHPVSSGHTIAPHEDKRPAVIPVAAIAAARKNIKR